MTPTRTRLVRAFRSAPNPPSSLVLNRWLGSFHTRIPPLRGRLPTNPRAEGPFRIA